MYHPFIHFSTTYLEMRMVTLYTYEAMCYKFFEHDKILSFI